MKSLKTTRREVRFFHPDQIFVGQEIVLKADASHHAQHVLRMKPDDKLTLFSGDNHEYYSTIVSVRKNQVIVHVDDEACVSRESNLSIHLVQAMIKEDKMSLIIQKAVELGVASITPLITSRTVVKRDSNRFEKKCAQWQSVAQGACEQSGRNAFVKICYPLHIDDMLQSTFDGGSFVLHPYHHRTWRDYEKPSPELRLIVGPEGGLTEDEAARLFEQGFQPLTFGTRILRAETAAIAGLSVLQAVWGDLQ